MASPIYLMSFCVRSSLEPMLNLVGKQNEANSGIRGLISALGNPAPVAVGNFSSLNGFRS